MQPEAITEVLKTVHYPGFTRDIVSFGLVQNVVFDAPTRTAKVQLSLTTENAEVPAQIKASAEAALNAAEGIDSAEVNILVKKPEGKKGEKVSNGANAPESLRHVQYVIAVASGKGGVGKSTVATNLACALKTCIDARLAKREPNKQRLARVGIVDCDIYGPSIPLMLGLKGDPEVQDGKIVPHVNHEICAVSMALLINDDQPVMWRAPMISKTIRQFASDVLWGDLDVLVVDLPPGTGDAQLTMVQTFPVTGAVIVTTPQKAAAGVAQRGAYMFEHVDVPLFGVVENMSYLQQPDGSKDFIFGQGGGSETAGLLGTELLGQVPLESDVRAAGDAGTPIVEADPSSDASAQFLKIAQRIMEKIEAQEGTEG